jgi:hypothetical protein
LGYGCGCHQGHGSGGASHCCCGGGGHPQHGCGCEGQRHHGGGEASHGCGCGHPFGFRRLFPTKEDEAAALEQYLKDLEAEAKGVRERLTELREA